MRGLHELSMPPHPASPPNGGEEHEYDSKPDVADDRQMVRYLARLGIGVAGDQRRARPEVDAVETVQDWISQQLEGR